MGPLSTKFSVHGHSQNVSLFGKIAESQFELSDFEKFKLKDAKRTDHTRPQLTTKLPLQQNYSSTKLLYELYLDVGPASGGHLEFGIGPWASKSGLKSKF